MNERIKELAEQADNFEISPDEEFCDTDFLADIDPRRVKKFAELILRECVTICNDTNGASYLNGVYAGRRIKEHFGVEE